MRTTSPIRDRKKARKLALYYLRTRQLRNYTLIMVCLYTALRIGDVLRISWDDVYDFELNAVRSFFHVYEKKTGKFKTIAINDDLAAALLLYAKVAAMSGAPLIINPRTGNAISRVHAYRIIRAAGEAVGIEEPVSCHSLRKTFGYHAWKSGVDPVILVGIFNHSSLKVTMRYLGITQDDKNAVYRGISFLRDEHLNSPSLI